MAAPLRFTSPLSERLQKRRAVGHAIQSRRRAFSEPGAARAQRSAAGEMILQFLFEPRTERVGLVEAFLVLQETTSPTDRVARQAFLVGAALHEAVQT